MCCLVEPRGPRTSLVHTVRTIFFGQPIISLSPGAANKYRRVASSTTVLYSHVKYFILTCGAARSSHMGASEQRNFRLRAALSNPRGPYVRHIVHHHSIRTVFRAAAYYEAREVGSAPHGWHPSSSSFVFQWSGYDV